jgi:predicted nucleotidyltransferase
MIIVRTMYGSKLYGTDVIGSDTDIRGVAFPDLKKVLLGTSGKMSLLGEEPDDDFLVFNLPYFVDLACQGQTIALEMLFAEPLESSPTWDKLVERRGEFITKKMSAFLGYARTQAHKYSSKVGKFQALEEAIAYFSGRSTGIRLSEVLQKAPVNEYAYTTVRMEEHHSWYHICGRQYQGSAEVEYVVDALKKVLQSYGERTKAAAERLDKADWKAVSHGIRVAGELKELYTDGIITFPRPNRFELLAIKRGDWEPNQAFSLLDDLVDEIGELSESSKYPETVDRDEWDDFVVEEMMEYVRGMI